MKLGQVALTVKELPAAVAFHRDVLGLPMMFEAPGLAFFDLGGVRLMLSAVAGEPQEFVMYFRAEDLNAAFHEAVAKGAQAGKEPHMIARMPDHELWLAYVRDPDGRMVALMSEVKN